MRYVIVLCLLGVLSVLNGCQAFGDLQEATARAMNPQAFKAYDAQVKKRR